MKFGTFVRIPAGGDLRENSLAAFARLQRMGLDACQLSYAPKELIPEDGDVIREAAAEAGIEISAYFCTYTDGCVLWDNYADYDLQGLNSPFFGGERIRRELSAIPFVKRLGVTDIVAHCGFIPNDPFADAYGRMVSAVRIIGLRCKAAELNFLFETGGETPVALLRLITDVGLDNLFVNLDTANLILYGNGNPLDALYTFGKYVRNTHMKDGFPPTDPRRIGKEVPLGEGLVDFDRVIAKLHELGYDRYLIVERELNDGAGDEAVMHSIDYLKHLYKKHYCPTEAR